MNKSDLCVTNTQLVELNVRNGVFLDLGNSTNTNVKWYMCMTTSWYGAAISKKTAPIISKIIIDLSILPPWTLRRALLWLSVEQETTNSRIKKQLSVLIYHFELKDNNFLGVNFDIPSEQQI